MNNPLLVILFIVFLLCVFGWPGWKWSATWGYRPFGGLVGIFLILLLILLLGGSSGLGITMNAHGCGAHW